MKKKLTGLTMFDLLKGIGIIMVVFFHSNAGGINTESIVHSCFHSVIMPMFFIMSGYWLKKRKVVKGIKYSAQYVLKPYLIAGLCVTVCSGLLKIVQGQMPFEYMLFQAGAFLFGFSDAGGTVLGKLYFGWNGPLWFMLALFGAWCIFYMVINVKKEMVQRVLVLLIVIAGCILSKVDMIHFFDIPQALIATGYVYVGYDLKKRGSFNKEHKWYVLLLMTAVWIAGSAIGFIDLASLTIRYGLIEVVSSIMGAYVVIYAFLWINQLELKWLNPVCTIGRYTNWILCIHTVEMLAFPWEAVMGKLPNIVVFNIYVIQLVARCVMIFVTCIFLKKLPLIKKKVFGK